MNTRNIYNKEMIHATDFIFVAETKKGNEKAFTAILNKYFNNIVLSLYKDNRTSKPDVEDCVLDAFVDLHINIHNENYEEKGKLYSYIYTLAKRKLIKVIKKEPILVQQEVFIEEEVFIDEDEKEKYIKAADKAINLMIGLCQKLIHAQFSKPKISDEKMYEKNQKDFTSIANVRHKRNRCMEKLRKQAKKILELEKELLS